MAVALGTESVVTTAAATGNEDGGEGGGEGGGRRRVGHIRCLEDELPSVTRSKETRTGTVYDEYPQAILKVPYKQNHIPNTEVRIQIARYFSQFLGRRQKDLLSLLPEVMPSWGKLQIRDGDSFRSASASGTGSTPKRDMSFIRYEIQVRRTQRDEWQVQIFYGRLECILVCDLPCAAVFDSLAGKRRLLAVITPCKNTKGQDASLEITNHNGFTSLLVTDLQSVVAVVGRIQTRGRWALVDRTGGLIRPRFIEADAEEEDPEGE
ncbi:hypothetical protein C8F04DRAFT_1330355 [Mycena alexandri]|uniref:Uncharacterized protein n=1 Tax=Mycena alexandri TaxID=1745969 RepID=A0AAD6RZ49_9AGAR|nr:hypothetical protein C8F04DRAFT_1330355 [Mycena alexandri]